jgi:flagellar export protein FliJ
MADNQDMTGPSRRFRLERVRALRERKEKLAQRELAQAMSRRSDTVAELRSAEDELAHARDEQRHTTARGGAVSAAELLAHQTFLECTEARQRQHASELELRDAEVAQRDAELATAATEHKMLQRLSERRRVEYARELARREVGALDEMAAMRFRRSRA